MFFYNEENGINVDIIGIGRMDLFFFLHAFRAPVNYIPYRFLILLIGLSKYIQYIANTTQCLFGEQIILSEMSSQHLTTDFVEFSITEIVISNNLEDTFEFLVLEEQEEQ